MGPGRSYWRGKSPAPRRSARRRRRRSWRPGEAPAPRARPARGGPRGEGGGGGVGGAWRMGVGGWGFGYKSKKPELGNPQSAIVRAFLVADPSGGFWTAHADFERRLGRPAAHLIGAERAAQI